MTIALIPARGGSKRIPRKNIKEFCGQPIIAYSIQAAEQSGCFDRIIVSTDDEEIASVAERFGAETPFIRPEELSDDYATTLDVIKHAIEELKLDEDGQLCCIYATAPFTTARDLQQANKTLSDEKLDYVFSATEYRFPIQRALRINVEGYSEMFYEEHENTRSQDLEPAYHDAGQFYFGNNAAFLSGKGILTGAKSKPLFLPSHRVQDIDTPDDWTRAEIMYQTLSKEH